jgi:CheY-like chemotaxis protein
VDGTDAVQKAVDLKPDIILVDVSMPGLNGFEAAECIYEQIPDAKILVITEHDSRTLEYLPPQPGVRGYVAKSRIDRDLVPAVEAASKHRSSSKSPTAQWRSANRILDEAFREGHAALLNGMNPPVPEVTVLIHRITKDRRAGEYRLHIKKVLAFTHWDKRQQKPTRWVLSEPRIDRLTLPRKYTEDTFVNPAQGFSLDKSVKCLDAQCEFAQSQRTLCAETSGAKPLKMLRCRVLRPVNDAQVFSSPAPHRRLH